MSDMRRIAPAIIGLDPLQSLQNIRSPQLPECRLLEGQIQRSPVQFQAPPLHGRGWLGQVFQDHRRVVAKANADIEDPETIGSTEAVQLSRSRELRPCFVQRAS